MDIKSYLGLFQILLTYDYRSKIMDDNTDMDNTTLNSAGGGQFNLGVFKICLFSTFFVLGLIGNSLVLIGIGLNKGMQTSTNLLIFNLAIADVLFIIVCIPTTLFSFFGRWPFTNFGCKLGKKFHNLFEFQFIEIFLHSTINHSFICIYEYLFISIHVN